MDLYNLNWYLHVLYLAIFTVATVLEIVSIKSDSEDFSFKKFVKNIFILGC